MQALESRFGRTALLDALRAEADALRVRVAAGGQAPDDAAGWIEAMVPARLAMLTTSSLHPVINATGVILHTNLGRAPLARAAVERVAALGGYTNIEYDVERGTRGRRDVHAESLLCRLTAAAAAVVVNNNAAATLLTLAAVAAGREVIVSRGELVEIGGGFRVPDVMAQSGAILREVGTTNRTRGADYAAAISERTAALLRVHPSNFRIEGFTERPALEELAALGRRFDIPVIEDIGSGWVAPWPLPPSLRAEPTPRTSLAAGVDLVLFSGDKLLGGPQAGIIAGRSDLIGTVRRHPLMRAMRVDKMTYAALEATLQEYVAGRAAETIPAIRMLVTDVEEIRRRARGIIDRLDGNVNGELAEGVSTLGGGSAPGSTLPTVLIAARHARVSATQLESLLRHSDPHVIGRIQDDRVMLDLRTVLPEQDERLLAMLNAL
jgi:L-seryl-tRNA(Ser) seleniumtransferase